MSNRKTHKIYVIGGNKSFELTNHVDDIRELIKRESDKHIKDIYSGNGYSIFTDYDNAIWATGKYNDSHRRFILRDSVIKGERIMIEYFKEKQISINKICTNPSGYHTFWISDKHQLYGNGTNDRYQLGLGHCDSQKTPILIDTLQNVMDAKSSPTCSFALCSTPNISAIIITQYWCKINNIMIPDEILNIIITYHHINEVYSTGYTFDGTNAEIKQWTKIEQFTDVDIIKIAVGYVHALFLSSNGNVWSCGNNGHGQLGDTDRFVGIQQIQYFINNSIFIKDIQCGFYYNLALTDNGRVYSWGENLFGQCGNGDLKDLYIPTLIETLKDYNIIEIGCGVAHCYAITENKTVFLWGDNLYGECLDFQFGKKKITKPFCIDGIVKEKTNGKVVKISLGYDNTKLFVM